MKAFGAGLMSSFTELQFAVESKDAHHVPFDLETVMRTGYEIDKFQRAYFVLPSFDALRDAFQTADSWRSSPVARASRRSTRRRSDKRLRNAEASRSTNTPTLNPSPQGGGRLRQRLNSADWPR